MTKTKHTQVDMSRVESFKAAGGAERLGALIAEAMQLANSRCAFEKKADGIVSIAEKISLAVTPHTPCSKGCNHCCYMAVAVSAFEADMIGRYLGRDKQEAAAVPLDKYAVPGAREHGFEAYTGVKCSLLGEDGKCTVYPVRPIACRTHHNLGHDETNCLIVTDKSEGLPTTPSINLDGFLVFHAAVFFEGRQSFADIREWFPLQKSAQ
jgi:uncharacterized protein